MTPLESALSLASRGWRVHPIRAISGGRCSCGKADCPAAGKHPRLTAWQHSAATAAEIVRAWWREHPSDGVGVATGPESGLVVIDLDPRHGGIAAWEDEVARRGGVPPTYRVRTGGGGLHLYYRAPELRIGNRAGVLPGVDVRGAGGYVVGPGSQHASGGRYEVEEDHELAAMPEWLVELCAGRPAPQRQPAAVTGDERERRYALAALDNASRRLAGTAEGGRHGAATREAFGIGGYVGSGLLSVGMARAALLDAALSCGLPEREAAAAVDAALAAGAQKPLSAPESASARVIHPGAARSDDPRTDEAAAPVVPLIYEQMRDYTGRGRHCDPPPWDGVFLSRAKTTRLPHPTAANIRAALSDDPRLAGAWWRDDSPRPGGGGRPRWGSEAVEDRHHVVVATWLDAAYGLRVSAGAVADQIAILAERGARDELRDWLCGLNWDGRSRADTWMIDYFGAEDTALHRRYARKWLIGCVARGMQPGCKADTALVLVGAQGIRKSTSLRALVGEEWYSDTSVDLASKDTLIRLAESWVVELSDMASYHRAQIATTNALLSSQADVYRPPYGRTQVRVPRRALFVGTENRDDFLADETGARRWWPVRVQRADPAALAEVREQLWAEAVQLWREGEEWHLSGAGSQEQAESAEAFRAEDPWAPAIRSHVETLSTTTTTDVLDRAVRLDIDRQDGAAGKRVAAVLRSMGWAQRFDRPPGGKSRRVWMRPPTTP